MRTLYIRDQTAHFVQSDLDLHCPQKLHISSSLWKELNLIQIIHSFNSAKEEDFRNQCGKRRQYSRTLFSFFQQCFKFALRMTKPIFWATFISHCKIFWYPWVLTYYQTTNFRLFQTERVCRQQFQIWRNRQEVLQTGRKHCGKRRNCS